MIVTIRGGNRIRGPKLDEYFNVTASVRNVYKMTGQKRPKGRIHFLICDLPDRLLMNGRPRPRRTVLIMGNVDKDYGLVVDSKGYLEIQGRNSKRKGQSCRP